MKRLTGTRMNSSVLIALSLLTFISVGGALAAGDWSQSTLLGVDMSGDIAADLPSGLDILSVYLDSDSAAAAVRLSLVQLTDPVAGRSLLPRDAEFTLYFDFEEGGSRLSGTRDDFAWDCALRLQGDDILDGNSRLRVVSATDRSETRRETTGFELIRDHVVWRLTPGDLPADSPAARLLFNNGRSSQPRVVVTSTYDNREIDRFESDPDRDYRANCALMHHGNQSLTYTDVFHGRWDNTDGSGFDEALEVHQATSVPGNFHLSGPLQSSADWDQENGDPLDFNGWLASGVSAGWAGMITSAYAQHIMPFVTDGMNSWSLNIHSDMTNTRYGYNPTVAWVPERVWLDTGYYPNGGVIDNIADNFLAHGVQAVILDDDVHCQGYDSHQIHTLAGSSLKVIPRDSNFTGQLHAGNGAGALGVLTGLAGSGVGEYRIAVYADDWEMAAEIGEWQNSMPNAKETYDWFVWKCHDESAWLSCWKLSDAVAAGNFNGSGSMNVTYGTYWSIGGTDGYGGANNSWYSHWAGYVPWVTGGNGSGGCAGQGGSCQNYGSMWTSTLAALNGAPINAISEAGWYAMMTNLYETGWHDYMGGPISGWENNHSAHVKNGRYYALAAHWGAGEWASPGVNAFLDDVDGDGFDELVIHNQRLLAVIESAGGRIVHLSVRDGDLVDTAIGADNVYWYGTTGDYNDGNHVAGLSEVSPDLQSLNFEFSIDEVAADSVQVTLTRDGCAKTLILRADADYIRCLYSTGSNQTYIKSGFSPSLVSLIWDSGMERIWDPLGGYMGFRNPNTGLAAGYVVGSGGANHSSEFTGRLLKGDELTGDYRFEFYLFAGGTDAPVGGELLELADLSAGLTDVLPPALTSAIYFPGTDRLRFQLDDVVDRGAIDPTLVGLDDNGDGVAELTLSAGTQIDGSGWHARVDFILTPTQATQLEELNTDNLTLLLASGAFADGSGVPNAALTGADAFPVNFGPPTLITLDGTIDHTEWIYCQLAVDDPDNDSEWSLLNELQGLYVTADDSYLYLALEGRVEAFNGWLIHLDVDYGDGTGYGDLREIPWWDKNAYFTYPDVGIDYLYGSWGGGDGNLYSIDSPTTMTDVSGQGVLAVSDQNVAWPGSELAIPWDLLYGLGADAVPTGVTLGLSAAIASGTDLGGDVMPNNVTADLPIVDSIALIALDADNDGVPDKPDHTSPLLLEATVAADSDTLVYLTFSEPLSAATAENPVFYSIYESLVSQRILTVHSATLIGGGEQVLLVTDPQNPLEYTIGVFGLRDASCYLNEINPGSNVSFYGSAVAITDETPAAVFALSPNWPNPFNPSTNLAFSLTEAGRVTLVVYDITGRRVAQLVNDKLQAGTHEIVWHGRDDRGSNVASGLYFAHLECAEGSQVRKMMLLK
ncbi:MAG: T9SS type A sorting domain-containing protein [bacterium]|nr:T9SS type A sorting domain-containing protein [bacterium]